VYHNNFICFFAAAGRDVVDDRALLLGEYIHGIQNVERHIVRLCLNHGSDFLHEVLYCFGVIELEGMFGELLFGFELVLVNLELWSEGKGFGMMLYEGVIGIEC
jgi:hypothetical protein